MIKWQFMGGLKNDSLAINDGLNFCHKVGMQNPSEVGIGLHCHLTRFVSCPCTRKMLGLFLCSGLFEEEWFAIENPGVALSWALSWDYCIY